MKVLESQPSSPREQPPDGGIFIPDEQPQFELSTQMQQEFLGLPRFTDTYGVSRAILGMAGVLNDPDESPASKVWLKQSFEREIVGLSDAFISHLGAWSIATKRVPIAPKQNVQAAKDDYGYKTIESPDRLHLVIPAGRVTAAQVLEFQNGDGLYSPVVDLRLKTSADKPIQTFGKQIESLGGYFRFRLADTQIELLG